MKSDVTKMAKKEKEAEFKRNVVMDSAWRVFMEKGFISTTMNDIADESEYALGTIYKIFDSKEEIFVSLVKKKLEELHSLSLIADDSSLNPVERIRNILNKTSMFFAKNARMLQVFSSERCTGNSEFVRNVGFACKNHFKELDELFEEIIKEGIKKGYFRNIEPAKARKAVKGLVIEFLWEKVFADKVENIEFIVNDVMSLFLYGIAGPKLEKRK